ncbi:MAG: zinc finger domain-containing protein, partial [Verrucomicrobiota bacterium]|nr:zinc finger domain-containing protein [Verrucomicrobiota bacterium]
MNAKIVVGVGNIYACEALFFSGINPKRSASKISRERYNKLTENIKMVLQSSIKMGGTTLRDFVNEVGEPGYFKQSLMVYGRKDEQCTKCDKAISRIVQTGRSTFYCSRCQK